MASTLTNLLYHIIFTTKDREPLLPSPMREDLESYIGGIVRSTGGVLLEIGGMPDHLHLITRLRAETSVAEMVRLIKSNSSKWLCERLGLQDSFHWQRGYGAFTVSASQLEAVRAYVRCQEEHHRRMTFQEEYIAFLERHKIEYKPEYLWDRERERRVAPLGLEERERIFARTDPWGSRPRLYAAALPGLRGGICRVLLTRG